MKTVPDSTDPRTFDVGRTVVPIRPPCEHHVLQLQPNLNAYECVDDACHALFEREPRLYCASCRATLTAADKYEHGTLCWGCWQAAMNEESEQRWAEDRKRTRSIPCPSCNAAVDRSCRTAAGNRVVGGYHTARAKAARA